MTSPMILRQVPFQEVLINQTFVSEEPKLNYTNVTDYKMTVHKDAYVSVKIWNNTLLHFAGKMPTTAFFKEIKLYGEQIFYNYRPLESDHWGFKYDYRYCLHCPGFGSPTDQIKKVTPHYIFDRDDQRNANEL